MLSGVESFQAVLQLQDWSIMSLLKVTRISISPGATSLVPASGMAFTTTGAKESISCARLACGANWQTAPMTSVVNHIFVFIFLIFSLVWFGLENQKTALQISASFCAIATLGWTLRALRTSAASPFPSKSA